MIGLTVLALLCAYVLFVRKLARSIAEFIGLENSKPKVLAVFVVLLVLPFADEIVGRVQFQYECKKIKGYTVADAIKKSNLAQYGYGMGAEETLPAVIPIKKKVGFVVDVETHDILLSSATLFTSGGWLMRSGLNMGNSSVCNDVNIVQVMRNFGFEKLNDGFFKKISGRE